MTRSDTLAAVVAFLPPGFTSWMTSVRHDRDDVEGLRESCLRGNCAPFALTLHARTGWPIVGLCLRTSPDGDAPFHLLCRAPDGRLVDAAGHHCEGAAIGQFDMGGHRDLVVRDFTAFEIGRRFRRDPRIARAVETALDQLVPSLRLALSTKDCALPLPFDCVLVPSA